MINSTPQPLELSYAKHVQAAKHNKPNTYHSVAKLPTKQVVMRAFIN